MATRSAAAAGSASRRGRGGTHPSHGETSEKVDMPSVLKEMAESGHESAEGGSEEPQKPSTGPASGEMEAFYSRLEEIGVETGEKPADGEWSGSAKRTEDAAPLPLPASAPPTVIEDCPIATAPSGVVLAPTFSKLPGGTVAAASPLA